MKIKIAVILIVTAIIATPFSSSSAGAKKSGKSQNFEKSQGWNKLDLRLKQAYAEAKETGDMDEVFECIMKISQPATDDDKALLKGAGFAYRSVIGKIITGGVAAGNLPHVTELGFVEAIELSTPMMFKKTKKSK